MAPLECKASPYLIMALPITEAYLKGLQVEHLPPFRLFVVQHLLEDTEEFLRLVVGWGLRVSQVIGIQYSSKVEIAVRLQEADIRATIPEFGSLQMAVSNALDSEIETAARSGEAFLIHEVGGYCAGVLQEKARGIVSTCLGVVEETKQGLWRYQSVNPLPVPVLQIADSRLKGVESRYVGEAIARAIESDLFELGLGLAGRSVGVLGVGEIGSAVAASFHRRDAIVSCFDPNPLRVLEARLHGFACPGRPRVLEGSEVIVGASGSASLQADDLVKLHDSVLLASASSKNVEFPVQVIASSAQGSRQVGQHVIEYEMPWGKSVRVASMGFPVNFRGSSLPRLVADLLFCQVVAGIVTLVQGRPHPGIYGLTIRDQEMIARLWLDRGM